MVSTAAAVQPRNVQRRRGPIECCSVRVFTRSLAGDVVSPVRTSYQAWCNTPACVDNPLVAQTLPRTVEALEGWNGDGLPGEEAYAAVVADLAAAQEIRAAGRLAVRLNYEMSGARSLIGGTARRAARLEAPYKQALIDLNDRWGEPEIWSIIKRESGPLTTSYYVSAVDMRYDETGALVAQPDYQQIYIDLFLRTLGLSIAITVITLLLGFPIAYLLATMKLRYSNLLMILVLLPFWTSLLVRTSAWKVLLQEQGVINDILVWIGLVNDGARLVLINNQIGTVIAMTHILLPFMILPLYSVMKTIPPSYLRAAKSMGANDWVAFWRVYFPQSIPGIGAGAILVFILAIGYYITPELVGGTSGTFISNRIAFHISTSLNWGLAAALGSLLLILVMGLYWLYDKIVGIDNVKLG